ncbi:signal peptidase II [Mucilaginibacter sp. dw_454]|uniref:signal peptidase II n=1 Tax=Mucilaginibacter sp. dw_454 TaxID=2720079 RepID=UPI001BD38CC6|nr:signal peptidase II [Mucilaginibacter sp. dw_454]
MSTRLKVFTFCLTCIVFIGLDRITKQLAREHLMYSAPKSYFHDTFVFEYVENTGAALSFGDSLPQPYSFWLLSIIPLGVIIALFVYVLRQVKDFSNFKLFCFAMIIAGGLGNIIDRIIYDRHVTDFMNLGIGSLRTGIFNVADVCITAGVIGLFIVYLATNNRFLKPDKVQ